MIKIQFHIYIPGISPSLFSNLSDDNRPFNQYRETPVANLFNATVPITTTVFHRYLWVSNLGGSLVEEKTGITLRYCSIFNGRSLVLEFWVDAKFYLKMVDPASRHSVITEYLTCNQELFEKSLNFTRLFARALKIDNSPFFGPWISANRLIQSKIQRYRLDSNCLEYYIIYVYIDHIFPILYTSYFKRFKRKYHIVVPMSGWIYERTPRNLSCIRMYHNMFLYYYFS